MSQTFGIVFNVEEYLFYTIKGIGDGEPNSHTAKFKCRKQ